MTDILAGVRVLERAYGIAGPYCGKVLADAGAEVVKVEPGEGDPLRGQGTGALFAYLNAGKRSVAAEGDLAGAADIVVADGPVGGKDLGGTDVADGPVGDVHHGSVVVTITPFGLDGPWAGRPATEFTLQAASGSIGQRGLPDQPPLAAGGRIGEWVAGTYAAAAALAAFREARRTGAGERVDIAVLDCMAVTMSTFPSVFASFLGWPPMPGTGRTVEVPSIEPTADGYVCFTTNSAQQFHDFLVLIGRPDLLDDARLARVHTRFARREEFLAAVHAYTAGRSTEEVLDAAAALRIPTGPVLDGAGVPRFAQFVERGVYRPAANGRFVQPRPPYRIGRAAHPPPGPVPAPGADRVAWEARPRRAAGEWHLPLEGLRVLDCTAWWAGPVAPHALACFGADVIKVESVTRPDLMRYSATKPPQEDRWWEWGPIFHAVNAGKRGVTIDLTRPEGASVFERLLRSADVLVENFTPRVMEQFGFGWERVHALNPRLLMVRMPAFGLEGPWRDRTGFAQTMESISGMAWLTGFADGPPVLVRGACDPLAGLHAVIATLLALLTRDVDGAGLLVESTMVEAALNIAAEQVVEHGAGGPLQRRDGNRGPQAAPQGVYRCAGDDRWVAISVRDDADWDAFLRVAGWDADPALQNVGGRRAEHDRIDAGIASWTSGRDADDVVSQLIVAGVPAAVVISARDVVDNPQLRHRRLFEEEDHPVTGTHELPAFPVRFGRVERWHRRPSPTLGQHNEEVLAEIGLADLVAGLRADGVIGERVAGQ